jgi:hypothetical protein
MCVTYDLVTGWVWDDHRDLPGGDVSRVPRFALVVRNIDIALYLIVIYQYLYHHISTLLQA